MAEGWIRSLKGNRFEAFSAGVDPKGLNKRAVQVMAEAGVDISKQNSRHINEFEDLALDIVVTVCGHAREQCPVFPGNVKVIHAGFDDPPKLAENASNEEERLSYYRRVRDEIRLFVENLPESLD